jgi:hypothetical protein
MKRTIPIVRAISVEPEVSDKDYVSGPNPPEYTPYIDWGISMLVIIFCIYQFLLNNVSVEERYEVGKIEIIFTNLFAIFVVIIAKGLWIKLLLLCTMVASIGWHLYGIGWVHLGDRNTWGRWDNVLSCMVIVAYAMTWIPNIAGPFKKTLPKSTDEWCVRPSLKLIINIIFTILVGVIVAYTWREYTITILDIKFSWGDLLALSFIGIAFLLAIFCIIIPGKLTEMTVFFMWATFGIGSGLAAYLLKRDDVSEEWRDIYHSVWHVAIFYSAYCFSRASDYVQYNASFREKEENKEEEVKKAVQHTEEKKILYNLVLKF